MESVITYAAKPAGEFIDFVLDHQWTGVRPEPHRVAIDDARQLPQPSLDTNGFILERLASGVTDYADPEQIERLFAPAVRDLILHLTGAAWVVTWAPNVRFSENNSRARSTSVSAPARAAHSDLGPAFNPTTIGSQPLATKAAAEYARRLGDRWPKRWRTFNIWQQISPPPQDTPLALCDLRTLQAQDVYMGRGTDGRPDSKLFELTFFGYNPAHRWYYYPDLLPGETIVFSGLDVTAGPLAGRVPHCAFDLPNPPPHTIPRNSIEIRALAIFAE